MNNFEKPEQEIVYNETEAEKGLKIFREYLKGFVEHPENYPEKTREYMEKAPRPKSIQDLLDELDGGVYSEELQRVMEGLYAGEFYSASMGAKKGDEFNERLSSLLHARTLVGDKLRGGPAYKG